MAQQNETIGKIVEVETRLVVCVVSLAVLFTRLLSFVLRSPFLNEAFAEGLSPLHLSGAFVLTCGVCYLVIALLETNFSRNRIAFYAFAAILTVAVAVLSIFFQGFSMLKTCLSAAALSILFVLHVEYLGPSKANSRTCMATAIAVASFVFLITLIVSDKYYEAIDIVVSLVPIALFPFTVKWSDPKLTWGSIPSLKEVRRHIAFQSHILALLSSIIAGLSLSWLYTHTYFEDVDALMRLGIMVLLVMICLDSLGGRLVERVHARSLRMPIVVVCLIPSLFLAPDIGTIQCSIAFVFTLVGYSSTLFALTEIASLYKYEPSFVYSFGRLSTCLGVFIGLAIGWVAFNTTLLGPHTTEICISITIAFCLVLNTLFNTRSYYPGEESLGTTVVSNIPVMVTAAKTDEETMERILKAKCTKFSISFGLTRRQAEVVELIARGYNSESISEELVISPHTVKAHIYTIYQKTGAHTRQELAEKISAVTVDERKKKKDNEATE